MSMGPQITITLGRSGQVVKRPGHVFDGDRFDALPLSGSKRSMREPLGNNKRQRGDSNVRTPNGMNSITKIYFRSAGNAWTDRNDLRFKLMRKKKYRETTSYEEQNQSKLHGKFSTEFHSPVNTYAPHRSPERKVTGPLRRVPSTRSADDLLQLNSVRKSDSAWVHEGLRHRSPDRYLSAPRGLSPSKDINGQRQVATFRPTDAPRFSNYMDKNVYNHAGPRGSVPFLTKATFPLEAARSTTQLPTPSGHLQKNSYLGDELHTVGKFLNSLGLGKYAILFQAEEVDMTALMQMRDNDLKELGIPMGPRRKILLAIFPFVKRG